MTKLYRQASASLRSAADVSATTERASIYDEVTSAIIAQLEEGIAPWAKPWSNKATGPVMPVNKDGRRYSGVNVLLLWGAMISKGYSSAHFMTFKQAKDLGGCVRKGEKATSIVYADRFIPKGEAEKAAAEGRDANAIPFLKRYSVFNVEQIDGLPARFYVQPEPVSLVDQNEAGERLIRASGADFRIGGDRAFYSIDGDYVQVPPQPAFHASIDYYRTAAHELCHWTGSAKRLARKFGLQFGNADYAREELVAELGAAFLCASLGINPTVRHADYLGSWLRVLKADNKAIFKAASGASKAADFLLALYEASPEPVDPDPKGKRDDVQPQPVKAEPVAVDPVAPAQPVEGEREAEPVLFRLMPEEAPVSLPRPFPQPVKAEPQREPETGPKCYPADVSAYYEGGRRVMRDGVPCKEFGKPRSAETTALKERLAMVCAGKMEWDGDANFPGFRFTPAEERKGKAKRSATPAVKVSPAAKAYYAGGHRFVIDGVPVRLSSRPTKNMAALLRQNDAFAPMPVGFERHLVQSREERQAEAAWLKRMGYVDRWTKCAEV